MPRRAHRDPAVGRRLVRLRGNMTPSEVARQVGCVPASISRWEGGRVPPEPYLSRLAKLYKTTKGVILDGEGSNPAVSENSPPGAQYRASERRGSPKERAKWESLIKKVEALEKIGGPEAERARAHLDAQ